MRDHPEDNAAFNRGLAEIRKDEQAAIAAAYDWTGVTSVEEVGAGAGSLLASIVAGNRGVRGVLFDRPDGRDGSGARPAGCRDRHPRYCNDDFRRGEVRQRTEQEYNELFAATRLKPVRVVETGTAFSILEASPS